MVDRARSTKPRSPRSPRRLKAGGLRLPSRLAAGSAGAGSCSELRDFRAVLAFGSQGGGSCSELRHFQAEEKKKKLSACRGEGSVVGLQLRVRFVPAALLAMLRTALALQCVSRARGWTSHVDR
jgi:hypothetical protein